MSTASAGYSGTPLPKKLGLKERRSVLLLGAPKNFKDALGELPEGATLRTRAGKPADIVMLFAGDLAELNKKFPIAKKSMAEGGRLWLAWPKKSSPLAKDLSDAEVRACGLAHGLVDFKVCAIDFTWSGLCFAHRR